MSTKWKSKRIGIGDEDLSSSFPDYEVVEHKILQFSNIDGGKFGNNKFYSAELQRASNGSWRIYTNFHRVADAEFVGTFETRGPGTEQEMRTEFQSLIKKKTGTRKGRDKYREIKFVKAKVGSPKARLITYGVDSKEIPQEKKKASNSKPKLDPNVISLVESVFNDSSNALTSVVDIKITADGFETPIGILSYGQIEDGQGALKEVSKAIKARDITRMRRLTSQYYSIIPHKLAFDITSQVIDSDERLQQELDVLQLMRDSLEVGSDAFIEGSAAKYYELGVDIAHIHSNADEAKRVVKFIEGTVGSTHASFAKRAKVKNVFKIILPHDRGRYDKCPVGNERELFHGSRNCNIVGILKRGLLIAPPEAPVSGWAFGKGSYFADMSSKSLQYSLKPFGKNHSTSCYLFLSRVKLGRQFVLNWGFPGYDVAKKCLTEGYDSTFGKASSGGLRYNEYITYKLEQNTLTHLVELERPTGIYY